MTSCAFGPCVPAACPLTGGCVVERYAHVSKYEPRTVRDELKSGAMAENGYLPARTNRDPALIKRRRKALTR